MLVRIVLSILLSVTFFSCEKKSRLSKLKQINATVVSATEGSISINTSPGNAYLGCGDFISIQGPSFVQAINDAFTAAVLIEVGDTCITRPGTYKFVCQYVKDYSGQRIIYTNDSVSDPGSITYTTVRTDFVEGHFHATCKNNLDSVTVNGTFKGYNN